MNAIHVAADPHRWPSRGHLRPKNPAAMVTSTETDFCGHGGDECPALEDCAGATNAGNRLAVLKVLKVIPMQGGGCGVVARSEAFLAAWA